MLRVLIMLGIGVTARVSGAVDSFTVTANHTATDLARPAEVIVVPFAEVQRRLPGAKPFHLVVKDARSGAVIPSQVTNYEHDHKGLACDDLLFQHDFAAGETTAAFRVERTAQVVAPYPSRVYARFVPERYDDFAWENDRIAHRMYGPGLDSAAAGREKLRSSGIDIWAKRVRYPVIDRWYIKGHDAFHRDDGEGHDLYNIGPSRGAGGIGIWDGTKLRTSGNFATWKVLANGPLRAVFELGYSPWDAGEGRMVSETKRFYVEAGRNLHRVESTFTLEGGSDVTVGIGITTHPNIRGVRVADERLGTLSYWENSNAGGVGAAVVLSAGVTCAGFAEEPLGSAGVYGNTLMLVTVKSGEPLHYYIGAGWDRSGDFADRAAWEAYVAAFARRLAAPLTLRIQGEAGPQRGSGSPD